MFINFDINEHLQDLQIGEKERMGDIVERVVRATVEAAVPAIIKAVKDVCLTAVKEEVNPISSVCSTDRPPRTNKQERQP